MEPLSTVSGTRAGVVAPASGRADDWYGDGWKLFVRFSDVYSAFMQRCASLSYLYGYIDAGL